MHSDSDSQWSSVEEERSLSDDIVEQLMREDIRLPQQQRPKLSYVPFDTLTDEETCVVCYESLR